ncbi:hypothetical protein [Clostridium sp. BJN0013]|uniref:hypothetical protein n=1 Tax=Clostridium sp. BJN0013 TaxID=3236840 RepID=UPI0034C5D7BA
MKYKLKLIKDKIMKNKIKALGLVAVIVIVIAGLGWYFYQNKTDNSKNPAQIEAVKTDKKLNITEDESNTKKLKKEKNILNGRIYTQNNKVIVTMVIKDGISDQEVKELAQKYAENMKKKYKNMPVTVMAVRDDKNVANITIK